MKGGHSCVGKSSSAARKDYICGYVEISSWNRLSHVYRNVQFALVVFERACDWRST